MLGEFQENQACKVETSLNSESVIQTIRSFIFSVLNIFFLLSIRHCVPLLLASLIC